MISCRTRARSPVKERYMRSFDARRSGPSSRSRLRPRLVKLSNMLRRSAGLTVLPRIFFATSLAVSLATNWFETAIIFAMSVAVTLGVLILQESFDSRMAVSAALVFCGVAVVRWSGRKMASDSGLEAQAEPST